MICELNIFFYSLLLIKTYISLMLDSRQSSNSSGPSTKLSNRFLLPVGSLSCCSYRRYVSLTLAFIQTLETRTHDTFIKCTSFLPEWYKYYFNKYSSPFCGTPILIFSCKCAENWDFLILKMIIIWWTLQFLKNKLFYNKNTDINTIFDNIFNLLETFFDAWHIQISNFKLYLNKV